MKIIKCDMNTDTADLKIVGSIDPVEYREIAKAEYEKSDITVVNKEIYAKLLVAAKAENDFNNDELFLLEIACEEVCETLEVEAYIYDKFKTLVRKIRRMRNKEAEK